MNKSESISSLAAALVKFQSTVENPHKNAVNPHFKSRFADLPEIMAAIRAPMAENGLAFSQLPSVSETGVIVETVIIHSSGEWISGQLFMPTARHDPQGVGSAITYARRYGLEAALGLRGEDDDGETAQGRGREFRQSEEEITEKEEARQQQARFAGESVKKRVITLRRPATKTTEDEYPANPLDESDSLPTNRIEPGEWQDVVIHFGKNKGIRLGDLEEGQLKWYRKEWQPRPFRGRISDQDTALRNALDVSMGKEPTQDQEEETEEVPF